MPEQTRRARILAFPYADSLQNARLDALLEETHGQRRELVMDYHELRLSAPSELFNHNGQPHERAQGQYFPRRIRFLDVQELKSEGVYTHLETVPPDHITRSLTSTLYWRTPEGTIYYLFGIRADEPSMLLVSARRCVSEERPGPAEEVADLTAEAQ